MMTIKTIIQCRMTSHRFPGKILTPFLGKPVFAHVVERIKRTQFGSSIILATSDDQADDPLVAYAKYLGLEVVRGSCDDVVERFALTLNQHKCDAFFRVCGDSPLLLSFLFNRAASIYMNSSYDIVTNVFPRTFPVGMSIELIRTKTFLETKKRILKKEDKEHLTKFFYHHHKDFQIHNIECARSTDSDLKLAVDELKDLERLEAWSLSKEEEYEDLFPILSTK